MQDESQVSRTEKPHVVIVGGGFGGLSAARELASQSVFITLIDKENHHLFQPLLYQVAMAGLSPADISMPIRSVFKKHDNVRVLLGKVSAIELEQRQLRLSDGATISYDYLVLATGATTNYFGHEASWSHHALGLKKIEDALEIRRRVLLAFEAAERENDEQARQRLMTFVVIGGGPTGVEVAGTLAELSRFVLADDFRTVKPEQAQIIVVEMLDKLLPGFDAGLAEAAKRQLEALGVEVRLGSPVKNIDENGVWLEDELLQAATVLWTAGVRASELALSLGVELDKAGRVPVTSDCALAAYPEVFVIGDMARFEDAESGQPLAGLAPVATQQGRYVARKIAGQLHGRQLGPFVYRDKGILATIGRSRAVLQIGRLKMSGFVAWLAWIVVHIWYLVGFRNRISVMLNWCWNYLTYRQGARLITGPAAAEELPKLSAKAERAAAKARSSGRRPPAPPISSASTPSG